MKIQVGKQIILEVNFKFSNSSKNEQNNALKHIEMSVKDGTTRNVRNGTFLYDHRFLG